MGEIVVIERGGSPRPIEKYITELNDGLNWIKIGDAPTQGRYITKTSEKIKESGLSKTRQVFPGDLILSNSMSFGKPYIMEIEGCIHDGWLLIRDKNNVFDLKFLCHMLSTEYLLNQYKMFAAGSTVNNLNKELVGNASVRFPEMLEQNKIGKYLESLDHLITLHQSKPFGHILKVIASYTLYWEQRKLGEIAERLTRKNEKLESTLPLTISAQYGLIDQNEFFDKRIASKDVRGYYLIKKGEFAYNKSTSVDAPFGAIKRLDKYNKGVLSTLYILFKIIDDTNTSSDYLVTYYSTDLWHKGIQLIAAEGARNHGLLNITPNDFFKTMLSIPLNVFEQQKIGNFFKSLDHLITLHQLEPFKLIFKAIAYRIIDYAKSKPPRYIKYADLN